ncbi:hypothetical protein RND81_08G130800 [Saponaria officinalis]|uniref:Retrotransposon gag domain-containing protein n=1 Tax=Saponaria officinalis TaxID=3572 RepID=A0AAW1J7K7_SAPOF
MTAGDSSSSSSIYKDPIHLALGDHSISQLIPTIFDGKAFIHWSRNVKLTLISKNKLGLSYITSLKELWDELNERYNQSNAPLLYQLRKDVAEISQGEDSVAEYYARLKSVWEDLKAMDGIPNCDCDVDVVAMIAQKPNAVGSPRFHASKQQNPPNVWKRDAKRSRNDKMPYFYDYCNKPGHTTDYCFRLKAANKNGSSSGSGNGKRYAANVEEALPFEADTPFDAPVSEVAEPVVDPQFVKAFMKEMFKVIQAAQNDPETSNFAGTILAFNAYSSIISSDTCQWIIDSGTSDHMSYDIQDFQSYHLLNKPLLVSLPDGQHKTVHVTSVVQLTPLLKLQNVLYLMDFRHKLLYVGRILDNSNFVANFTSSMSFRTVQLM